MCICKYCGKKYIGRNKKSSVINHEQYCELNTNRIYYECNKCNKKFPNIYALNGHKASCGKQKKIKIKKIKVKKIKKHICSYCNKEFKSGQILGGHKANCKAHPDYEKRLKIKKGKLSKFRTGKKLSKKTKEKISKSRIKYLKENPSQVPYLLNHSSKISYPEQTMIKYLNKYNIKGWIHQMQFSIYQLDFAFPEYRLCVEIDGSTHLLPKVKAKDKKRDKYLNDEGWRVLRITAKKIQHNVYECINIILNTLGEKQIEIPQEFLNAQYYKEEKRKKKIEEKKLKEIERKNKKEELYNKRRELILNSNIDFNSRGWLTKLSKYLNMSDNGIKKFMKLYMKDFYDKCF